MDEATRGGPGTEDAGPRHHPPLRKGPDVFRADSDDVRAGWPARPRARSVAARPSAAVRTGGLPASMVRGAAASSGELRVAGAHRHRPGAPSSPADAESAHAPAAPRHAGADAA